jgi:hypothetical protein
MPEITSTACGLIAIEFQIDDAVFLTIDFQPRDYYAG